MPPEEANCLVAVKIDRNGSARATGERVFSRKKGSAATISWYTTGPTPTGYTPVLDGLVYARTNTILTPTTKLELDVKSLDGKYSWKDQSHSKGLMFALCLPANATLEEADPPIEEAKVHRARVAVYWHIRPPRTGSNDITISFRFRDTTRTLAFEVDQLNRGAKLARARPKNTKYDVALSFAGEERKYVHRVAECLADRNVSVFYDNFERADLWGRNLYHHLADVYGRKSRFSVIFLSSAYARKVWTRHERKAAQAKASTLNGAYILYVRFDNTRVSGVSTKISYVLASDYTPKKLAELIEKKLMTRDTESLPS